ncbi:MAG: histidinol-phosphate transaminase [Bacteroidales bacterium]|nr:histidinol-phosphate transaminase [Bacteroidales bacterium]
MNFDITKILRPNLVNFKPYSSARDEYSGANAIFLDANENPFESGLNRYPDPYQKELKKVIAGIKEIEASKIFLGNGSDEPIDLLYRAFCEPGIDNVVSIKPTYGMYKVCADINNVTYREVYLTPSYQLDVDAVLNKITGQTKLIFICSPNNPTSNCLLTDDIIRLVKNVNCLVVLDEAYIDFSSNESLLKQLNNYPNLVILQTFSKAWGMAGIRLGMAFASEEIVRILSHIKYPYNINVLTQREALNHLQNTGRKDEEVALILKERDVLQAELQQLKYVENILPSDANFLMIKVNEPRRLLEYLVKKLIIIRDRSKVSLCEGYVRITIGSPTENHKLVDALKAFK